MTTDPSADLLKLAISNGAISAIAVVSAAFLSATALWFYNSSLASKARRADYLREQIKNLYGPVTFLLESGERSMATHNQISAGYEEYFPGRHRFANFEKEMKQVLDAQNYYGSLAVKTNREAVEVLKEHWGWLDADDAPEVGKFVTHVDRQRVESDDGHKLPVDFYLNLKNKLPPPTVFHSEWPNRFRTKLKSKQEELAGVRKRWRWPFSRRAP